MIASLFALLPNILLAVFMFGLSWFILRIWYSSRYIHKIEVKPLQESQHMMQNQYAILAERIKHTESVLNETKKKLDTALEEREEAVLKLKEYESTHADLIEGNSIDNLKATLIEGIKSAVAEAVATNAEEKASGKEQINFLRQSFKEFKLEFTQKFNTSTNQYHELSNQLWQLIEINKKLNMEAEQISKAITNSDGSMDETKLAERQFTLASIKKRS